MACVSRLFICDLVSQSKRKSLIESLFNTAAGFGINTAANYNILPLFGLYPTVKTSMSLAVIFTVISVARNYAIRRFFNRAGR